MFIKKFMLIGLGAIIGGGLAVNGLVNSYASHNNISINLITPEKAKEIMLSKVPGAKIVEFSFDDDDKIKKYDGTLIKSTTEYDIDVDAKTGKILSFEEESFSVNDDGNDNDSNDDKPETNTKPGDNIKPTPKPFIGEATAKQIMLSKVPGASFKEFYLDNDSTPEYEATLIKSGVEYEISVDAITGKITEFEKEIIDNDDDNDFDSDDNDDDDDNDSDDDDDDDDDDNDSDSDDDDSDSDSDDDDDDDDNDSDSDDDDDDND